MMPELTDLLIVVADKHRGEVRHAKAHFGAEQRREEYMRDFGDVDGRWGIEEIVAIAALFGRDLAEVAQQDRSAAGRGLDEAGERVQPLALEGTAVGLDLGFDPPPSAREIVGAPEQPRL